MDRKRMVIIVVALVAVLAVLLLVLVKLSFGEVDNSSPEQMVAPSSDETREIVETEAHNETEEVSSEPEYELERDTTGIIAQETTAEEKQEQKENLTETEAQEENVTVLKEEGSEETNYLGGSTTEDKAPVDWETDERG